MSSLREAWSSRVTGALHSMRSWTPWWQRTRQSQARRDQENRQFLELQLQQSQEFLQLHLLRMEERLHRENRLLLLQALRPLAEAMQRQDSLQQSQQLELKELLLELLQATHSNPLPPPD